MRNEKSIRHCVVAMAAALVASSVTSAMAGSAAVTVFSENFDDGNASARWSAPVIEAETGTFDGQVDYAIDYSALGIPAAPSSGGTTTGVLFEVNTTDQGGDQGESVGIVPVGFTLPTADYRFSAEVYFNVESQNAGSTEFGLMGVHAADFNAPTDQGLNDDLPFDFGISNGNGLAYHFGGDSGAFNDFHRYEDAGNADTGSQTPLGSWDQFADPGIPGIDDVVNEGPSGQWVTFAIERVGDDISLLVNGFEIDSIANGADYVDGNVVIGYADYFNSVAVTTFEVGPDPTPSDGSDGPFGDDIAGFAHFAIFDNVVVQVIPEPATGGLLALAGLALGRRRRA